MRPSSSPSAPIAGRWARRMLSLADGGADRDIGLWFCGALGACAALNSVFLAILAGSVADAVCRTLDYHDRRRPLRPFTGLWLWGKRSGSVSAMEAVSWGAKAFVAMKAVWTGASVVVGLYSVPAG